MATRLVVLQLPEAESHDKLAECGSSTKSATSSRCDDAGADELCPGRVVGHRRPERHRHDEAVSADAVEGVTAAAGITLTCGVPAPIRLTGGVPLGAKVE